MTTIADIRTDLVAVLNNVAGWSAESGYVGDQVDTSTFKVSRASFDPRYVFDPSKRRVVFNVTAYAPRAEAEESEAALDALAEPTGAGSLIETVQDGTLWSVDVDFAQVVQVGEVTLVQWADNLEYLACQFQVEVVW